MNAYESGSPAYFATPPVNLFYAYHASLSLITGKRNGSDSNLPSEVVVPLEERFALHKAASQKVKSAAKELGMGQLPQSDGEAANGMTAVRVLISQGSRFTYSLLVVLPGRPWCCRYPPQTCSARHCRRWWLAR